MITTCEVCGKSVIRPRGQLTAPYLLMGEFPGREEVNKGVAAVGKMGEVLDREMVMAGIPMQQVCVTNLWLHEPARSKGKTVKSNCLPAFISNAIRMMEGRKGVMLMGSELANIFLNDGVMDWSGMEVQSILFPSCGFVMIMPNPALAFHGTHGEMRLALQKFKERISRNV
jgi:uracil-DNA glycosylase family 4